MSEKTTVRKAHVVQQHRQRMSKGRVAAFDLIIGLNMLGIEGRKLLIEYILLKRQGRGN